MLISILVARGFKIETLTSVTLRNIVRLRGRCVKS